MTSSPPNTTASTDVELILAQLDNLPPLAPVAARILALTTDPKTHARQITQLVGSDPSLTARVLSILGRAHHGLRPEAVTLENSVQLLGFETIRQIALAQKVLEVFGGVAREGDAEDFSRMEFWKHCLAVACAARQIAMKVRSAIAPEEAFILGLLHDLGKIALYTAMPKSYQRAVRAANQSHGDIAEAELRVLGVDHAIAGHRLAERWALPPRLVDCVWLHHQEPGSLPESVAAGRHVQIVQLADTLAREQRIGYSGNHRILHTSRSLAESLGLHEDDRQAIVESLAEEIEERATWIGAEEITSRDIYLRALLQSTEDLTAANAALSDQNRRLQRKAGCLTALGWLSQAVSPRMAVREVCAAGAEALRRAIGPEAVAVFAAGHEGRWMEVGLSAGAMHSEIINPCAVTTAWQADTTHALRMAEAGVWIMPVGRAFGVVIDRYQGRLGEGQIWLLPIVCQRNWVAGAIFAADPALPAEWRGETAELEALSAAVGLAIAQAQAQSAARTLSDELARINRRWAAMQAEVLRSRTLQSIVAMAAGAAHELNNPLAVISGRAQMLRAAAPDPASREALDTIVRQAHDCSDIVRQLMEFAEPPAARPEHVALQDAVAEASKAVLSEEPASAALAIDLPAGLPPVWFDRAQLVRILRELFDNAWEATQPDRRRITIKAAPDLSEETLVVSVSDNGRGMTAEALSRAMDPFFSSRPAGRGRGLGLARVGRWLSDGRGAIRIESTPDVGTSVEIRLPLRQLDQGIER